MSIPDEPSHVTYAAAAARGQFIGNTAGHPDYAVVQVPMYVTNSAYLVCFRASTATTAACQNTVDLGDSNALVDGVTTSTLNSPLYFVLTGLPTLVASGELAFSLMRVVSALLCSLLLAIAGFALVQLGRGPRATVALVALFAATTPMLLFLGGSVNPNSAEVCAAIAVTCCLLLLGQDPDATGRLHAERLGVLTLSTLMLVNTRSLSLAWLLAAVVVGLAMAKTGALRMLFSRRSTWAALAIISLGVMAAVVWFLIPKGLASSPDLAVGTDVNPWYAFGRMVLIAPLFAIEWVGVFGWLDTPLPIPVYVAYGLASAAVVAFALRVGTRARRWLLIGIGIAIVFIPAAAQALLIGQWGWVWQGRYHLALFGILMVVAGATIDVSESVVWRRWNAGALRAVLWVVAIIHVAAFIIALYRYTVGTAQPLWSMFTAPAWQPPGGTILLTLLVVGAVALPTVLIDRRLPRVLPITR